MLADFPRLAVAPYRSLRVVGRIDIDLMVATAGAGIALTAIFDQYFLSFQRRSPPTPRFPPTLVVMLEAERL
jgi:hypothetical protein